jgi:SulP family sulfate permease
VGLVQGAGVGQSFPNPDGRFPDPSRDFAGQGLGNLAASFFEAIPSGGSMSGTAVSVQAGAQTRWANVAAGLFVVVIVLLFVDLVKLMPMAGLGGLLVVVGYQNLRPTDILTVWHTNRIARAAMVTTLLATLTMPLQFAILAGVAISFLLHVFRSSKQIEVVEFVPTQGFPIEQPAPAELTPEHVTVLHARGDLFFAAAANFEQGLPAVGQARRAVVIFNVRERPELGSTIIGILTRYARSLEANGGKLMLSGVSRSLREQLDRTGVTEILGSENLFAEQPQLGEALNAALTAARAWLQSPHPVAGERPSS